MTVECSEYWSTLSIMDIMYIVDIVDILNTGHMAYISDRTTIKTLKTALVTSELTNNDSEIIVKHYLFADLDDFFFGSWALA